jgi:hypothetical protein
MCFDFVEINEELPIFFRVIVLESRPTDDPNANSNLSTRFLYILSECHGNLTLRDSPLLRKQQSKK